MKAQPTKATLFAVERVIAVGEELTAAEVAERAGMSTRYARDVLAVLANHKRIRIVDGGMVGALRLQLYGRDAPAPPAPEPLETISAGSFTLQTRDPVLKAVMREFAATERELELMKTRTMVPDNDALQVSVRPSPTSLQQEQDRRESAGGASMRGLYTIVGMKHLGVIPVDAAYRTMERFVAGLPKNEPLLLVREPGNQHDPNAVQVWARSQHVGYVKGTQSRDLSGWINIHGHPNVDPAIPSQLCVPGRLAVTAEKWPCAEVVEEEQPPAQPAGPEITEGREVTS